MNYLQSIQSLLNPTLRQFFIVGTAGNASGLVEYIAECEEVSRAKSDAVWRIKKLYYDAGGIITDVVFADGDPQFNKIAYTSVANMESNYTFSNS